MAILKHIASKSSNYGAALEYLIFKHDELRKTPILDQNGNRIMRDEFYLDGLNCEPYSFDAACQQLNREYQKNKNKNEIKSHHYIISFDPRDSTENCLTGKRAQKQLIRDAVATAREKAISYEDFQDILQDEYDIFVKAQRGRYSYLPPERNKFISERSLGESCKRECLEGFFVQNAEKNLRYKEEPILIFTNKIPHSIISAPVP